MFHIELENVQGDYGFVAKDANGHTVNMDTSESHGGVNFGIRPMQMLLMGLGGCSAIDIVSILKKQRQPISGFSISIDGERDGTKEPSLWKNVKIVFNIKGDIDVEKAKKACSLSMDKYCSVAKTLRLAGADLQWEVNVIPN